MYDDLVKRLREVEEMLKVAQFKEAANLIVQAADAIEELLTLKALADEKIERSESAKAKKKRPPKRLPCTCGRKQLDLWWSSNPGDEGWFLKCPNCGRQSQPEKFKCHVNSAWNNGLPEPPKEETWPN